MERDNILPYTFYDIYFSETYSYMKNCDIKCIDAKNQASWLFQTFYQYFLNYTILIIAAIILNNVALPIC